MNNYPSKINKDYYEKKYNLKFKNVYEATIHYIKYGKTYGFFPNKESENFYCKFMNFDTNYYIEKYKMDFKTDEAKRYWCLYGSSLNHYVNRCDEKGTHIDNCNCIIKSNTINIKPTHYTGKILCICNIAQNLCKHGINFICSSDNCIKTEENELFLCTLCEAVYNNVNVIVKGNFDEIYNNVLYKSMYIY